MGKRQFEALTWRISEMKRNGMGIKAKISLKLVILLLPFVLGIIGFMKLDSREYNLLNAAYASLQMYFTNVSIASDHNIYIEIGRWLAPFSAIFLGIGLVVDLVKGILWPRLWSKLPSRYVVYGDDAWVNLLCRKKGRSFSKYCIMEKDSFVNCRSYVLLFDSDRKNLDFYTGFLLPRIGGRDVKVYMNLLELEPQDIQGRNLITFQINEFIALSFFKNPKWIDFELSLIEEKRENAVKIGIIGFGDLGRRMLQTALVMNIVSVGQKTEYHVWGDVDSYQKKHTGINDRNLEPDRVVFHREDVNDSLRFLEDFDVILLCGQQDENLLLLSDLLRLTAFVGRGGRIYAYVENKEILKIFQVMHISAKQRLQEQETTFLVDERLFPILLPDREDFLGRVISDDLSVYQRAKKKHDKYIADSRKAEAEKGMPEYDYFEWEELNSYLRWDNVSSANYDDVRSLLQKEGVIEEQLAEFEHRRWLRSHYLDNWEYSSQRDDSLHRHPDLQDFYELDEEEQRKDRNFCQP